MVFVKKAQKLKTCYKYSSFKGIHENFNWLLSVIFKKSGEILSKKSHVLKALTCDLTITNDEVIGMRGYQWERIRMRHVFGMINY